MSLHPVFHINGQWGVELFDGTSFYYTYFKDYKDALDFYRQKQLKSA